MKSLIALAVAATFASVAQAADEPLAWPQFRGPGGSGVADDQNPPVEFGPDKNVKWKVPVPSGQSSPIIVGDKLVITAFDEGRLYTVAYNCADGVEAWRREAPAKQIEKYFKGGGSPAASTPATDGERIVSYFGSCGLFCYDSSGKELWKYEMPMSSIPGDFGTGTSPILVDNVVVLVRDQTKESKVIALDAATGGVKWEKKRQSPASYSTPAVWDTPDGKQLVAAGHGRMIAYDLMDGAEKWFVTEMPSSVCPTPVTAEGTLFFAGWSPGGADDKEFQMPPFDGLLQGADEDKDGALSREEFEASDMRGFFDTQDANDDGKVVRDEWDAVVKFMSEGHNSAFAIKAGGSGDITNSHILWKQSKGLPYVPSAILYGGQYVLVKDGGIITAYDARTGGAIYTKRTAAGGPYYASPVGASGRIYFISLNEGVVTVLKAGADKPEVIAKNPALAERVAATPAIADDTLYVRTEKHLYAFAESK